MHLIWQEDPQLNKLRFWPPDINWVETQGWSQMLSPRKIHLLSPSTLPISMSGLSPCLWGSAQTWPGAALVRRQCPSSPTLLMISSDPIPLC